MVNDLDMAQPVVATAGDADRSARTVRRDVIDEHDRVLPAPNPWSFKLSHCLTLTIEPSARGLRGQSPTPSRSTANVRGSIDRCSRDVLRA
jgi:hypothetical protein